MHIKNPMPRPRIAPVVRFRRGVSAAVTMVACVALLSACGSSKSSSTTSSTGTVTDLNTTRVATSIEQSIYSERHLHARVVCPVTVVQEQGKTFECIATTRATKKPYGLVKTPFVVTVQNNKGYVTYAGK
jgi:hypothetical protein